MKYVNKITNGNMEIGVKSHDEEGQVKLKIA